MIASGGCHTFDEVTTDCIRGEIIVWDAEGNRIGLPLIGHTSRVWSLSFSPDGKILASGSRDGTILLWDVIALEPIGGPLTGHIDEISSLGFSTDSKSLVSTSYEKTILWDIDTQKSVNELSRAVMSPDGEMFATLGCSPDDSGNCTGSSITITDRNTGTSTELRIADTLSGPTSLAFSPDGKILAFVACILNEFNECVPEITLWNLNTNRPIGLPLIGHTGEIQSLVFSQDGTRVASGTCHEYDLAGLCTLGETIVWEVGMQQQISVFSQEYPAWPSGIALSPDGKTLISGSYDNKLSLWNVDAREPLGRYFSDLISDPEAIVALRHDGKFAATANCLATSQDSGHCTKSQIRLWDVLDRKQLDTPVIELTSQLLHLTLSADGHLLATVSCQASGEDDNYCAETKVILWDLSSGTSMELPHTGFSSAAGSLTFSPDSKTLATFGCQSSNEESAYCAKSGIVLWNIIGGKPVDRKLIDLSGEIRNLVFSQANSTMAASVCQKWNNRGFCVKGEIILWDIATHTRIDLSLAELAGGSTGLALSRDGKTLAFVNCRQLDANGNRFCLEGEIILWDVANDKRLVSSLRGFTGDFMSLSFSLDGKMLAAGGCTFDRAYYCETGQMILWDITKQKPSGWLFDEHNSIVNSVHFSTDDLLISKRDWGYVSVWGLNLQSSIETICQRAGRNLSQNEWDYYLPGEKYRKTCEQWPNHPSYYEAMAEEILSNSLDPNRVQIALDKVRVEMQQDSAIGNPISESRRIVGQEIEGLISDSLTNIQLVGSAIDLGLDLDLYFLNNLCWNGSLEGYAAEVLKYCEQSTLSDSSYS